MNKVMKAKMEARKAYRRVMEGVDGASFEVGDSFDVTDSYSFGDITVEYGDSVEVTANDGTTVTFDVYDEEGEQEAIGVEADVEDFEDFLATATDTDADDYEDDEEDEDDFYDDDYVGEGKKCCKGKKLVEDDEDDDEDDEDDDDEDDDEDDDVEDDEDSEDDEDDVEEAVKKTRIRHGKKVRLTANQIKASRLRAAGKVKPGYKVVNGKIVKMSSKERMARKKQGKKLARLGKAMRRKSMKKARVSESFSIETKDKYKFIARKNDVLESDGNTLNVYRKGRKIVEGIEVNDAFMGKCVNEGVAVMMGGKNSVNEGNMLTFRAGQGYVLVSEGSEIAMGNRIRTRAFLTKQGYTVDSDMLDKASQGKMVIL